MENQEEQKQFNLSGIKLIVGLGNIGKEYTGSRHNIGFEIIENLAGTIKFLEEKKLKGLVYTGLLDDRKIIFLKPTTFMNSSGEAVVLTKNFYKIEDNEILVIHDDLDLQLGSFKIQFGKGPKVHNGILSIENRLGSSKFWRLRIGVENRTVESRKLIAGYDYVLGRFTNEEKAVLAGVMEEIKERLTISNV